MLVVNLAQDDRPYCHVKIGDLRKAGLLDSWSSVTVITECSGLGDQNVSFTPSPVSLKAANGAFLEFLGCVPLPIQYLGETVEINTIVVQDLAYDWEPFILVHISQRKEKETNMPEQKSLYFETANRTVTH